MTPFHRRAGLIASVLLAALAAPAAAGTTTGFAFLDLPAGARVAAMGGAGATLAEGPAALFWNPAAIAPAVPAAGSRGHAIFDHNESIQTFRQRSSAASSRRAATGSASRSMPTTPRASTSATSWAT
jgi:hypothetical protein